MLPKRVGARHVYTRLAYPYDRHLLVQMRDWKPSLGKVVRKRIVLSLH
jgi:hypothetical protein